MAFETYFFFKLERDYVLKENWWSQLAISRTKNQKNYQVYVQNPTAKYSDLRLKLARVQDVWAPDEIEMGPEWFGFLAQVKSGPRQKWDILS